MSGLIDAAHAAGRLFWLQEHGLSCGDMSDRWVSWRDEPAHWFLHSTFAWLEQGVDRISLPIPAGSYAAPLQSIRDSTNENTWLSTAQSLYYAMEMFARIAGKGRELIEIEQTSALDAAHAWGIRESNGDLHVLLVKRLPIDGYVSLQVPGATQAAREIELAYFDENVALGNLFWNYTGEYDKSAEPQGSGRLGSWGVAPGADGTYRISWSEGRELVRA